jgi:hypothetical protein
MGDFNARTGSEEDLIISDDTSHVPLSDINYTTTRWFIAGIGTKCVTKCSSIKDS